MQIYMQYLKILNYEKKFTFCEIFQNKFYFFENTIDFSAFLYFWYREGLVFLERDFLDK